MTGTGSGADYWVMVDAGAHRVVDFTDGGLASTYRVPFDTVEANAISLIDHLTNSGCTEIVVEVADGLFQAETAHLLRNELFRTYIDGVIFAASDAMGAVAGGRHLLEQDAPLLGITGVFTRSPLGQREAMDNCDVPILLRPGPRRPPRRSHALQGRRDRPAHRRSTGLRRRLGCCRSRGGGRTVVSGAHREAASTEVATRWACGGETW